MSASVSVSLRGSGPGTGVFSDSKFLFGSHFCFCPTQFSRCLFVFDVCCNNLFIFHVFLIGVFRNSCLLNNLKKIECFLSICFLKVNFLHALSLSINLRSNQFFSSLYSSFLILAFHKFFFYSEFN